MRGGKKFSRFVYRRMEIGTLASSVIEHFATSYFNPVSSVDFVDSWFLM